MGIHNGILIFFKVCIHEIFSSLLYEENQGYVHPSHPLEEKHTNFVLLLHIKQHLIINHNNFKFLTININRQIWWLRKRTGFFPPKYFVRFLIFLAQKILNFLVNAFFPNIITFPNLRRNFQFLIPNQMNSFTYKSKSIKCRVHSPFKVIGRY